MSIERTSLLFLNIDKICVSLSISSIDNGGSRCWCCSIIIYWENCVTIPLLFSIIEEKANNSVRERRKSRIKRTAENYCRMSHFLRWMMAQSCRAEERLFVIIISHIFCGRSIWEINQNATLGSWYFQLSHSRLLK